MPIAVRCKCGKKLAAPDQAAGRRVKCPACGEPITVPASSSPAPSSASPPAAPATSDKLTVACACGKKLAVPASAAGKRVKCPACSQPINVPAARPVSSAKSPIVAAAKDDMTSLFDEVDFKQSKTGRRCPECRADLQPDDVLCIKCGFNTETGRQLKTKRVEKAKGPIAGHGHGAAPSAAADAKSVKSKATAPPKVKQLAKHLQFAGLLPIVIYALLAAALIATSSMAANSDPNQMGVILGAMSVPVALTVVLQTIPCLLAANLVLNGKALGRIFAIILGILSIPSLGIGILILLEAFSPEVTQYCQ